MIPDIIINRDLSFNKTINLRKLIGKNVLSKGGTIIGKISEVRVNPKNLELEGIFVKRGIFRRPIYIGRNYFSHLSEEAVILSIEVSVLIKNRQVMSSEGKIMGKVKKVMRKEETNELESIVVKSLFSRTFIIPESAIKHIGKSVVLRHGYNARKKYFWQRHK